MKEVERQGRPFFRMPGIRPVGQGSPEFKQVECLGAYFPALLVSDACRARQSGSIRADPDRVVASSATLTGFREVACQGRPSTCWRTFRQPSGLMISLGRVLNYFGRSTASRSTVLRTLRVRGAGRGRFASALRLSLLMYIKYITSLIPSAKAKRPPPQQSKQLRTRPSKLCRFQIGLS